MTKRIITLMIIVSMTFGCVGCEYKEPKNDLVTIKEETPILEIEELKEPETNTSTVFETEEIKKDITTQKTETTNQTTVKKEESKTTKKEIVSTPQVDTRDKITMIDKNTIYMENAIYYKSIPSIEDYIAKVSVAKVEMPDKYRDLEQALLAALQGTETTFTYTLLESVGSFTDVFENNHMSFGDCSGSIHYSCPRQIDNTYLFTVDLTATRNSMADAKTNWESNLAKQEQSISQKKASNDDFNRKNALYKEKINQCVVAAGITKGMAVEDALIKIDAYIRKITTYDYSSIHYNFYDIFDYGNAVCNGYAHLFFLMAQRCGIDCKMVSSASMNHIWNVVTYDGKTLYIDSTWNDTSNSNQYLLVSKEQLTKTHTFSDAVIKAELHIIYQ